MMRPGKISLLIADVDGTLVTHDKVLTDRAQRAVSRLDEAGILELQKRLVGGPEVRRAAQEPGPAPLLLATC